MTPRAAAAQRPPTAPAPHPDTETIEDPPTMPAEISWTEWTGYAAASLTTLSFVPQAWLTLRTRDVSGISLGMYSVFTLGTALWLAWGIQIGVWPVAIANAITLTLATTILGMKVWLSRRRA
jgi:MtN3 and saliva related transmembrane protein